MLLSSHICHICTIDDVTVIDYVKNITNGILNDTILTGDNGQTLDIIRIITDLLNNLNHTNSTTSTRDDIRNTLIGK